MRIYMCVFVQLSNGNKKNIIYHLRLETWLMIISNFIVTGKVLLQKIYTNSAFFHPILQ